MDQQCPLFLYYLTEIDGFVDTQVIILLFVCLQGRLGIKGQTSLYYIKFCLAPITFNK